MSSGRRNKKSKSKLCKESYSIKRRQQERAFQAHYLKAAASGGGSLLRGEALEVQVQIGNVTTRVRLPMPAPMFAHGENVFVQLPAEHLFEVSR